MIIKGKPIAQVKEKILKAKIKELKSTPCLGIILIGKNPASLIYVKLKEKNKKVKRKTPCSLLFPLP